MNRHEKIAHYLMQAQWEEATKVITRLRETDLKKIVALMTHMEMTGHGQSRGVAPGEGTVMGGAARAHSFLQSGLKMAAASAEPVRTPWLALRRLPAKAVAQLLEKEHPQTIALILGKLEASQAAQVMETFPLLLQSRVARCMIAQHPPTPETLRTIESALLEHLASLGLDREDGIGGTGMDPDSLTTLLQRQRPEWAGHILQRLDQDDAALAERLGRGLILFEDLILLDDRSMQQLMRLIDLNDLYCALSHVSPALTDRFFNNMSQRVRQLNREDMASKPPPDHDEIRAARLRILERVHHLLARGIITLCGKGNRSPHRTPPDHDIHPVIQSQS